MPATVRAIDHTGDLGFEIRSSTPEEALEEAGRQMLGLMLEPGPLEPRERRTIEVAAETPADLFYQWLRELLVRFAVDGFIPFRWEIETDGARLAARLEGDVYDPARHVLVLELKAVTLHTLAFEPTAGGGWFARVIFDV